MNKLNKVKIKALILLAAEVLLTVIFWIYSRTKAGMADNIINSPSFIFIFFAVIFAVNVAHIIHGIILVETNNRRNKHDVANTLGADIKEAFIYGQIGLLVYDGNKTIVWSSELFDDRNINCVGYTADEVFPELKAFFKTSEEAPKEVECVNNNRIYRVINNKELDLFIFKDVTELENLYQVKDEQEPVYIALELDNLDDLESVKQKGDNAVQYELEVRKAIIDWANKYEVFIKDTNDDTYLIVAEESKYKKMREDKFSIMDTVHEITKEATIPLTISLGIGRGSSDFAKLAELSNSAMDVALSRGGGQIVISNYGSHMEFFGGTSEIRTKKNAVRSRVFSQSLSTHIEGNNRVFIVPHTVADMDAIGSALGLYELVTSKGKEVHIVCTLEQMELKTRAALKEIFSKEEIEAIFINEATAIKENKDKTLVILTDVNRPGITTCPKLLEVSKNVAIIDHHRRSEDAVDNPIFSIIETTASSASEIVIGLVRFNKQKIEFSKTVATMLFAGLLLDTNGFRANSSAETFEAAMSLKEQGADATKAQNFLKDEYEEFELKNKILSNAETISVGIVVTTASEDLIVDRTILAKVGQDALGVKGVRAMFVIGQIGNDIVGVSARSDGSFNVQYILEKLGGGGHFAMAAAQIEGKSIAEVKNELIDLVNVYLVEQVKHD